MRKLPDGFFSRPSFFMGLVAATVAMSGVFVLIRVSSSTPLGVGDVEGVWRGESGERVSVLIREDGTATLQNVPEPCPSKAGGYYSGPAVWEFHTVPDESPGVLFRFPDTLEECTLSFSIVKAGGGFFTEDQNSIGYVRD